MDTIYYRGQHERDQRVGTTMTERRIDHGDPVWVIIVNGLRAGLTTAGPAVQERPGGPAYIHDPDAPSWNETPAPDFHVDWSYKLKNGAAPLADKPPIDPCGGAHFWTLDPDTDVTYCAECGTGYDEFI